MKVVKQNPLISFFKLNRFDQLFVLICLQLEIKFGRLSFNDLNQPVQFFRMKLYRKFLKHEPRVGQNILNWGEVFDLLLNFIKRNICNDWSIKQGLRGVEIQLLSRRFLVSMVFNKAAKHFKEGLAGRFAKRQVNNTCLNERSIIWRDIYQIVKSKKSEH